MDNFNNNPQPTQPGASAPQQQPSGAPQQPSGAPQQPYGAAQPPYGQQPTPYPPQRKNHTVLIVLCVLIALLGMLIVTCPDTNAHRDAIKRSVTEEIDRRKDAADNSLGAAVGGFFAQQLASLAVDNMVQVDNYFIFSVGRVHFDGKDHTLSFGILGHVYTMNANDAAEAVEKIDDEDDSSDANLKAAHDVIDNVEEAASDSILPDDETVESLKQSGKEVGKAVRHAASTIEHASGALDKAASALDKFLDESDNGE